MQINLPSRSCIRDSQEADTPTHGRSHGLWQRHGEEEEISCFKMLLVRTLLFCIYYYVLTNGMQKESNQEEEEEVVVEVEEERKTESEWM